MKRILVLAVAAAALLSGATAAAQGVQPRPGDRLFDLTLPVPGERADRNYLGLSGWGKTFRMADIKANLVLIEILSMYCPFCQKEAPVVNRLHEAIEKDPATGGKIKIIGVGAGNSSYEVEVFRKNMAFPSPFSRIPTTTSTKMRRERRFSSGQAQSGRYPERDPREAGRVRRGPGLPGNAEEGAGL